MALPKQHRLRHRRDFNRVYRSGLRRKSRHLTLRALNVANGKNLPKRSVPADAESADAQGQDEKCGEASPPAPPTRIGISISTKVNKRAVVRNRIKRRIKSAMFHLLPTLSPGWLLVVIVRPGTDECDYWQFLRELEEMIKSLR